jgi:hypothetical protein
MEFFRKPFNRFEDEASPALMKDGRAWILAAKKG